jgi:2-oxoacid:acceptor oxidoreductase gamma subunit (pyruvate/2-ketoisovalerate family)
MGRKTMAFLFLKGTTEMMYEIIWHGRGGQGVVIAAQMMAEAAYFEDFKGVTATPTFGPERRGAPLTASTRISREPIRTFSQIRTADITVVLDESLLNVVDVLGRVKKGGLIIVNTALPIEKLNIDGDYDIAVVDAVCIALKHHLTKEGAPVVNTPLLGALAKVTGLVSLGNIERALQHKLSREHVAKNLAAAKSAYEETQVRKR